MIAFGIYDAAGSPAVRIGAAPPRLTSERLGARLTRVEGDRLSMLRPVGRTLPGRMPPSGPMPSPREMPHGMGHMRGGASDESLRQTPMEPGASSRGLTTYLEYDVSGIRSDRLLVFILVALLTTLLLFGLLLYFGRRLRLAEATAHRHRRMAELGEAARTLTHEIRNPLGALKVQASLLKRTLPAGHEEAAVLMDEEIGRIAYLVDRVREFLKNPVGNAEPIELKEFLEGLGLGEEIEVERESAPAYVRFDQEKLRSVIENLVANAREAQKDVGAAGPVEVVISRQGSHARLEVRDRGAGIPRELQEKVFDPFFTTKSRGSGVGLAISKRFVEAAGGELELLEREGGGTVAVVTLPAEERQ